MATVAAEEGGDRRGSTLASILVLTQGLEEEVEAAISSRRAVADVAMVDMAARASTDTTVATMGSVVVHGPMVGRTVEVVDSATGRTTGGRTIIRPRHRGKEALLMRSRGRSRWVVATRLLKPQTP